MVKLDEARGHPHFGDVSWTREIDHELGDRTRFPGPADRIDHAVGKEKSPPPDRGVMNITDFLSAIQSASSSFFHQDTCLNRRARLNGSSMRMILGSMIRVCARGDRALPHCPPESWWGKRS